MRLPPKMPHRSHAHDDLAVTGRWSGSAAEPLPRRSDHSRVDVVGDCTSTQGEPVGGHADRRADDATR